MKCGMMGWGLECFWTGFGSLCEKKDKQMHCITSLWMFPIYGMASMMAPLCHLLEGKKCHSPYQCCVNWPGRAFFPVFGFFCWKAGGGTRWYAGGRDCPGSVFDGILYFLWTDLPSLCILPFLLWPGKKFVFTLCLSMADLYPGLICSRAQPIVGGSHTVWLVELAASVCFAAWDDCGFKPCSRCRTIFEIAWYLGERRLVHKKEKVTYLRFHQHFFI